MDSQWWLHPSSRLPQVAPLCTLQLPREVLPTARSVEVWLLVNWDCEHEHLNFPDCWTSTWTHILTDTHTHMLQTDKICRCTCFLKTCLDGVPPCDLNALLG